MNHRTYLLRFFGIRLQVAFHFNAVFTSTWWAGKEAKSRLRISKCGEAFVCLSW